MRIQNRETLVSHGNKKGREIIVDLLDAGLDSLDPYNRVKEFMQISSGVLTLDNRGFEMQGDPHACAAIYDLKKYEHIYVIGAAKGIQRAAKAMEEVLGEYLTAGHVIGKHGEEIICEKIKVTLAGHPVPDEYCVQGCQEIEKLLENVTEKDLVFTIFGSGCGSLFTYPAGDITIEDISAFTHMMQIEKGVPTSDLNQIRTHIDQFKGGRITRKIKRATLVHMVTADPSKMNTPVLRVSYFDMLKNNTFFPTVATASTYQDCIEIIKKWDAWEQTPKSIKEHLLAGNEQTENMSIEEYESINARFFGLIFKDSSVYPAVRAKAKELGIKCLMLNEYQQAEAREAGYVDSMMALSNERLGEPFETPIVLMSSGENVVTVGKENGVGGRNQEYCLAAAMQISGSKRIVIGAVDTDGTDGPGGFQADGAPKCLSGAVVDGYTMYEASEKNVDLFQALKTHATSQPMWELNCGVVAKVGVSALDLRLIYIE